ncbi:MAG: MarR family winged helix-turn-helix transcriptional regulator, partial [bacterium]
IVGSMIEFLDSFVRFRRAANLLAVQAFKPLGLGNKQAAVLLYLSREGHCSQADLARHTITDPAATGRIVTSLIRCACVAQKEHPTDRRRWVLSLTPKGRGLAAQVETIYRGVAAVVVRPLSAAGQRNLVATLDRLTLALAERKPQKKERL